MVGLETDMPVLDLVLESGTVKIMLRPDLAPNHVSRIIELSESGFYDGIVFHRVIEGFMAQTGDPTGTGMGGSELPDIKAEFSDRSFERGTLGMARSQDPDSANSQFFIVFGDAAFLNGEYTLFGKVIEGMELVDAIRKGAGNNGEVTNPDRIVSMRLQDGQ
ncbi:MAG: peptidylprolyl isomerase [Devosiaceae bacterium]|nr:peptidylprolyl isomerase [Devosiaceae bacterium]